MKMYGISNCDTIKKAKKFLESNNIVFDFIDYKKIAPSKSFLQNCKKACGELPVNKRGTTFRKLKEQWESSKESDQLKILIENSSAIKRPIVEFDSGEIVLGFDEIQWKKLFL